MFLKKATKKRKEAAMIIDWEGFKEKNKEKAKEIETLCQKISAGWPESTLSEKEKEEKISIVLVSADFLLFKETIEGIVPEDAFSAGDWGMLALSQVIAARSITK